MIVSPLFSISFYNLFFNCSYSQQKHLGIFIPECHPEDGSFLPEQCNVTSGECWCVDNNGDEKPNTRAQVQRGTRNCSDASKGDANLNRKFLK